MFEWTLSGVPDYRVLRRQDQGAQRRSSPQEGSVMNDRPQIRTAGLWLAAAVGHLVSAIFICTLCLPLAYDMRHGFGSAGDGYMLPFFLIPIGGPAAAISLWIDIRLIQKKSKWSWALWPVVVVFGITLISIIGFVILLIGELAFHRRSR
jgi:hypothetical protein